MERIMMAVSYHREMKQNYLMIEVEEEKENRFETKMLSENSVEGLLRFRIRRADNQCFFCYEITSRQPLSRMLEKSTIGAEKIRQLILGICRTFSDMEKYLLLEEQLLLEPEFIYVNPENFTPSLCLMPGRTGDFPKEFSDFLQFLLEKVDHQDKEAVVMIYGLYRESLKENYGLENLLQYLREGEQGEEAVRREGEVSERGDSWPASEEKHIWEEENGGGRGAVRWEKPYIEERKNSGRNKRNSPSSAVGVGKQVLVSVLLLPVFLILLWLWKGIDGIRYYGLWALPADIMILVLSSAFYGKKVPREEEEKRIPDSWQIRFEEAREREAETKQIEQKPMEPSQDPYWQERQTYMKPSHDWFRQEQKMQVQSQSVKLLGKTLSCEEDENDRQVSYSDNEGRYEEGQEDTHTVLLWSRESQDETRHLISLDGQTQMIPIAYYPFLIGKQEGINDYILTKNTISRLHVRIDSDGENYSLTDLNSTNGTSINGKKLDANETMPLSIGDEVSISDLHFRFQ